LNGSESPQTFHRLLIIYILLLEIQLSRGECWDITDNFIVKLIVLFNWENSVINSYVYNILIQYPARTISKMIHYFLIMIMVFMDLMKIYRQRTKSEVGILSCVDYNMHSPVYKGYKSQLVLLSGSLLY
jgi:hypothetical protein